MEAFGKLVVGNPTQGGGYGPAMDRFVPARDHADKKYVGDIVAAVARRGYMTRGEARQMGVPDILDTLPWRG